MLFYKCSDELWLYYRFHCDGRIHCPDGFDETQCWPKSCVRRHGEERCFHGACITDRNLCCATREGVCVKSPSDAWARATDKTLVYADGRDLYSLNLTTGINRRLHRQEKLEITALTHGADGNTIFWAAGSTIWNTTLAAEEGDGQLYGQFGIASSILTMAYEWTTGNFYLAFQDPKLVVCHRHAETTEMFCSESIKVSIRQVDWLALQPNTGRMYMASFTQPGIEIVGAECDGSNSRPIYESKRGARQHLQLTVDANEILILNTEGEGTLSAVSALNGNERLITRNITEAHSAPLALFNEIAILRLHDEIHMLMFWDNKTVVKRRQMPSIEYHSVTSISRLFTLMDKETELKAENRCDNRSCDQLCLLVPHDAICACDSRYELMEDGRSCVSRNEATWLRTVSISVAIGIVGSLVTICCCVLLGKRFCRRKNGPSDGRVSPNLVNLEGLPINSGLNMCRYIARDPRPGPSVGDPRPRKSKLITDAETGDYYGNSSSYIEIK